MGPRVWPGLRGKQNGEGEAEMEPDSPGGHSGGGSCANHPRQEQTVFGASLATWELRGALGSEDWPRRPPGRSTAWPWGLAL